MALKFILKLEIQIIISKYRLSLAEKFDCRETIINELVAPGAELLSEDPTSSRSLEQAEFSSLLLVKLDGRAGWVFVTGLVLSWLHSRNFIDKSFAETCCKQEYAGNILDS